MQEAYDYFVQNSISFEQLAQEIKEDFSATHCISANNDKELEKNQLLLNTLEDIDNPYRAVFAVDKLNEGWDVLNLFDIVRLYETRDGKNGKSRLDRISSGLRNTNSNLSIVETIFAFKCLRCPSVGLVSH